MTYSSGNSESQVDYALVAREELKRIRNVATIASEECVRQHRLLVMDWGVDRVTRRETVRIERVRVWRLREEAVQRSFQVEIRGAANARVREADMEEKWRGYRDAMMGAARKVWGV